MTDGSNQWRSKAINPYLIGYTLAFDGFTKTMKAQADADKARAELCVSIVSIVGGSLLMATVGESALRVVAGNAALDFICNRNLNRTFNALAITSENKTFMFALGKTLDALKDETGKRIKDRATELLKSEEIKTSNPLVKYLEFDSLIRNHITAANHAAETIEADTKMEEAKKAAAFAALNAAPICSPPTGNIDSNLLAQKIELGIYLTKVMTSGVLDNWGPASYGQTNPRPISEAPIAQRPLAPDYPRSNLKPDGSGQTIGYTMTSDPFSGAGAVRDRIDELHKAVFKEDFYPKIGVFGTYMAEQKRAEVVKAEQTLDRLGRDTQPPSLLRIRS